MADDFEVRGAETVDHVVRQLRTHGDAKALKREFYAGLNRSTKPVKERMIESAIPQALPRRGGLAAQMQKAVKGRTAAKSGKWAGVSLRFSSRGYDIRTLVGKRLRHPVYGNRDRWVTQTRGVNPDVFPESFQKQKPEMVRAVNEVAADIARKVTS